MVLKWEAQRRATDILREWEGSTLISCNAGDMSRRHAQAVRRHAVAVTAAGGEDAVTASCGATLAHVGKIVDAVSSLLNRNLTSSYWKRVESIMPLAEVRGARAQEWAPGHTRFRSCGRTAYLPEWVAPKLFGIYSRESTTPCLHDSFHSKNTASPPRWFNRLR